MMCTNPLCSQFIYSSVNTWNTLIGPVKHMYMIDTLSGPHGMTLTIITQCNTPVTVYIFNLNIPVSSMEFIGLHNFY